VTGTFTNRPAAGHIAYGLFMGDPAGGYTAGEGLDYSDPTKVTLTVFQAKAGDANGDAFIDIGGDGSILIASLQNPTGKIWTDADFNGDGFVDIGTDASFLISGLQNPAYCAGGTAAFAEPAGVVAGTAAGEIAADGSIFLEMELGSMSLYSVYVGDAVGEDVWGSDVLSMEAGETHPEWVHDFSTRENNVDNTSKESFAELSTNAAELNKAPLYDTLVNVDLGALNDNVKIWLKYQTETTGPFITELPVVPEPSTLLLLLAGFCGLLVWRRRWA